MHHEPGDVERAFGSGRVSRPMASPADRWQGGRARRSAPRSRSEGSRACGQRAASLPGWRWCASVKTPPRRSTSAASEGRPRRSASTPGSTTSPPASRRDEVLALVAAPQRRPGGPRHPGAAAAAQAPRRRRDPRGDRLRRRTSTASTRSTPATVPRAPGLGPARPLGIMRLLEGIDFSPPGEKRSSSAAATSSASRWRMLLLGARRHGHRLPLARATCRRGRSQADLVVVAAGEPRAGQGRVDEAGRGGDRRGNEPQRRRASWWATWSSPPAAERAALHHAGPGRRGADDRGDADGQTPRGEAIAVGNERGRKSAAAPPSLRCPPAAARVPRCPAAAGASAPESSAVPPSSVPPAPLGLPPGRRVRSSVRGADRQLRRLGPHRPDRRPGEGDRPLALHQIERVAREHQPGPEEGLELGPEANRPRLAPRSSAGQTVVGTEQGALDHRKGDRHSAREEQVADHVMPLRVERRRSAMGRCAHGALPSTSSSGVASGRLGTERHTGRSASSTIDMSPTGR